MGLADTSAVEGHLVGCGVVSHLGGLVGGVVERRKNAEVAF